MHAQPMSKKHSFLSSFFKKKKSDFYSFVPEEFSTWLDGCQGWREGEGSN